MVCVGVWPLWCFSVLFVGYIKAFISELWSVLECGRLFCYSVLFVRYIKALISELWSVGVWPLWCYSVLFVGYIKSLLSELWSVLECGPYDVTQFCLYGMSRLWYQSCGLCWNVAPIMLLCSLCRIYQGFDIWIVVFVGVCPYGDTLFCL